MGADSLAPADRAEDSLGKAAEVPVGKAVSVVWGDLGQKRNFVCKSRLIGEYIDYTWFITLLLVIKYHYQGLTMQYLPVLRRAWLFLIFRFVPLANRALMLEGDFFDCHLY